MRKKITLIFYFCIPLILLSTINFIFLKVTGKGNLPALRESSRDLLWALIFSICVFIILFIFRKRKSK